MMSQPTLGTLDEGHLHGDVCAVHVTPVEIGPVPASNLAGPSANRRRPREHLPGSRYSRKLRGPCCPVALNHCRADGETQHQGRGQADDDGQPPYRRASALVGAH